MLQRTGEAETITTHYLAALGLYRGLYIPNWMYRCVILLFCLVVAPPRSRTRFEELTRIGTLQKALLTRLQWSRV